MESLRKATANVLALAREDPVTILLPLILGSVVSSAAILSMQLVARARVRSKVRVKGSLSQTPSAVQVGRKRAPLALKPSEHDERLAAELVREQLSRNFRYLDTRLVNLESFFGEDAMKEIQGAFVIVVGLGGVGSHCAHMLARSGVARIRVIDFDQVSLSSLNRHAVATQKDVGKSKVKVIAEHFLEICPHVKVEERNQLFSLDSADELLAGSPNFVLDCIGIHSSRHLILL